MSTIIKQQYGQKIDATGVIQIFHFETDSDMVLIEGEPGTTLTKKIAALVANRTISLSGGVTGSATYNGVDSVSIDVEVGVDSHEHTGATIKVGAAGRVVVTGDDESLNVSSISETELGYLSGVTGNIQQQLNVKASGDHNHDSVYLKQILLGVNGGIAPLDENGKILAQYLPSYVDDVIEGAANEDLTAFTDNEGNSVTPEAGKLYNDIVANQVYRWSGTHYAPVGGASGGVALGETMSTAYRGDRGKIAYEHSQTAHAPSNATIVNASSTNGNVIINGVETNVYTHPAHTARASGLYKIIVDALGHVTAVAAVTKADITDLGIPGAATTLSDLGITATATELNYMDGVTSNVQTQLNSKAASSHGTHVTFSTTDPVVAGTAAVGTATTVSRSDHVHPAQTSVSGNAGTATKWATARNINGLSVDGSANRVNYGSCSTAAATAAKTVACTGFTLVTGAEITVKFTVTNTAASPTLNVNSTGAKAIYYRGAAISAGYLAANRTYTFRYNGTQYELVGDINTNTTYSNMTAATADAAGKAGLVPAPAAGKQTSFLRGDGTWAVPTNTKNTAGSTDSSSKLFLIGATSQAANPQTYSHNTVYIGTDGCLYSASKRVVNIATGSTQPTDQLAGDLWFETIS